MVEPATSATEGIMNRPTAELLSAAPLLLEWCKNKPVLVEQQLVIGERFLIRVSYTDLNLSLQACRSLSHLDRQQPLPTEGKSGSLPLSLTICSGKLPDSLNLTTADPVLFAGDKSIQICVQSSPHSISCLDSIGNNAFYWIEDSDAFPWYEQTCPFRNIFHWWFRPRGIQLLHGAVVASATERATLIVGSTGSGKSTTMQSCMRSGMYLIADDVHLVDMNEFPYRVYALYNSIKFNDESEVRLNSAFSHVLHTPPPAGEKYIGFMQESIPAQFLGSAQLSTLVVNSVHNEVGSKLTKVHPTDAKQLMAPMTEVLLGPMPEDFFAVFRLLKSVPCYTLHAGASLDQLAPVLQSLLANHP